MTDRRDEGQKVDELIKVIVTQNAENGIMFFQK